MKRLSSLSAAIGLFGITLVTISAEDNAAPVAATELAARLSARQNGSTYVRLRMELTGPRGDAKQTLQLHIKSRRTENGADVVYQVLFPRERKGEAVLLRESARGAASATHFIPPDKFVKIDSAHMNEPLLDSNLAYEDAVNNFFAWQHQAIVGKEVVDQVNCEVLESKPGKGDHSSYASVRSWVDPRRNVALRVEKYSSAGRLARRIDTTQVSREDDGAYVSADLAVRCPGRESVTVLGGSRIRRNVTYSNQEFTPEGLSKVAAPR